MGQYGLRAYWSRNKKTEKLNSTGNQWKQYLYNLNTSKC